MPAAITWFSSTSRLVGRGCAASARYSVIPPCSGTDAGGGSGRGRLSEGTFDDRVPSGGVVDRGDAQAGALGEGGVVVDGALATADQHEHAQVHLRERGG